MNRANLLSGFLTTVLCFGWLIVMGERVPELPIVNQWNEQSRSSVQFRENKGQVRNQNGRPRSDVLYSGNVGALHVHFRKNGLSYQMFRVDTWKNTDDVPFGREKVSPKFPDLMSVYRTDLYWEGANPDVRIEAESPFNGYSNFYNVPEGVEPALYVKDYSSLWFRELFPGIDLNYYGRDQVLKYDFHVSPGADWRQICIRVEGAIPSLLTDGTLMLETPWGTIKEEKPVAYQQSTPVEVNWVVQGNTLSFQIVGAYDPEKALVIDPPVRLWGTYYGGVSDDHGNSCSVDMSGFVYLAGMTGSPDLIATAGAHQVQHVFQYDAFLVKFDSHGVRLWGTYYGGYQNDVANACAVDEHSNIYLAGQTEHNSFAWPGVIETPGAHQTEFGFGVWDAFLVKFNSEGIRSWGTFYGGSGQDYGLSCSVDKFGHVYLAGATTSSLQIATVGAHQAQHGSSIPDLFHRFDGFLVKFNSDGVRLWGTYYGGSKDDFVRSCAVDESGYIYTAGETESIDAIATVGAHQPLHGNPNSNISPWDAFLVKFNSNGERLWGTYYGGDRQDHGHSCTVDAGGHVYLAGATSSNIAIATVGAHQPQYGLSSDAFLVKFDSHGVRLWGTYYGGNRPDRGFSCVVDANGNVYLVGETESTNAISTIGAHQTQYGGGSYDAFIVKFNVNGVRMWGTYFGGSKYDKGLSCAIDDNGNVYLAGQTTSSNAIATGGAHQIQKGGDEWGWDAFLVKFSGTEVTSVSSPTKLTLGKTLRAWPIPFTETLHFSYELEYKSFISVALHDLNGRKVSTLDEGTFTSGKREVQSSVGASLSPGVYLLVLQINGLAVETIRVVKL